jgi:hypothetical protein
VGRAIDVGDLPQEIIVDAGARPRRSVGCPVLACPRHAHERSRCDAAVVELLGRQRHRALRVGGDEWPRARENPVAHHVRSARHVVPHGHAPQESAAERRVAGLALEPELLADCAPALHDDCETADRQIRLSRLDSREETRRQGVPLADGHQPCRGVALGRDERPISVGHASIMLLRH